MNQIEGALNKVRESEQADIMKWKKLSGATPETLEMTRHYEALVSNAKKAANSAQWKIDRLRADDTIPIESRQRQAREALAAAKTEIAGIQRAMQATLTVMEAHLQVAAHPKLDKAREMAARDEARMILDGSDDPVGAMVRLAQRDDELGAVVATGWGRSYLTAKRVDGADEAAAMVRRAASASAVESADPSRKAAGEALAAFGPTLGDGAATNYLVRQTLDEATAAAQALGATLPHD